MSDRRHPVTLLLEALHFSADKHRDQRRKDHGASPYINHPIEVATVLATVGGVTNIDTLVAAVLHDTIEDTQTTADGIEERFGPDVRKIVEELTDDKDLPKYERKRLQVTTAPRLSAHAKVIRIADKICNVRDVAQAPPAEWSLDRKRTYLDWTAYVVEGCRGVNKELDSYYDEVLDQARAAIR